MDSVIHRDSQNPEVLILSRKLHPAILTLHAIYQDLSGFGFMVTCSGLAGIKSVINLFPAGEFRDFHICVWEKLWGRAL